MINCLAFPFNFKIHSLGSLPSDGLIDKLHGQESELLGDSLKLTECECQLPLIEGTGEEKNYLQSENFQKLREKPNDKKNLSTLNFLEPQPKSNTRF